MNDQSVLSAPRDITVQPVTNRREMGVFIDIPWRIYADDPMWVPPLRLERRLHFQNSIHFLSTANGRHGSHTGIMNQWDGSVPKLIKCTDSAMVGTPVISAYWSA